RIDTGAQALRAQRRGDDVRAAAANADAEIAGQAEGGKVRRRGQGDRLAAARAVADQSGDPVTGQLDLLVERGEVRRGRGTAGFGAHHRSLILQALDLARLQ